MLSHTQGSLKCSKPADHLPHFLSMLDPRLVGLDVYSTLYSPQERIQKRPCYVHTASNLSRVNTADHQRISPADCYHGKATVEFVAAPVQ